ncbi:DUF1848 domain-containing protein [Synergistaceae bacterium OttesenSCG-928-D05]|nr:DUF1848 domain-containing protein [Synergistaceae bacterium OttesenSCG-928-D05]
MIISASRRTDIPAFYTPWFLNRLVAGYVLVRNPMDKHQVSKVSLNRDVVDGFVFWTKNPAPMIETLGALRNYPYYFQFTLTPYDSDVERYLPPKEEVLVPVFQKLSEKIGANRVIWRYDPIFINEKYTAEYHLDAFEKFCALLSGYTKKCVINFIDMYHKTEQNMRPFALTPISIRLKKTLLTSLSTIAKAHNIQPETCSHGVKLDIPNACCVDGNLFEEMSGFRYKLEKDKYQRVGCNCKESIDIGGYNTCGNGCLYCYANINPDQCRLFVEKHNQYGEFLTGKRRKEDRIYEREMYSCKDGQTRIFPSYEF